MNDAPMCLRRGDGDQEIWGSRGYFNLNISNIPFIPLSPSPGRNELNDKELQQAGARPGPPYFAAL
jgi:hypothetical protein